MMMYVVYWLFDETCVSPKRNGYVGVTGKLRLQLRMREHRSKKKATRFHYRVLFEGSEQECFSLEAKLRPAPNIGWNLAAGGPDGYKNGGTLNKGRKRTPEQLKRLSDAHKNSTYKATAEHRKNISAALMGHSVSQATIDALKLRWQNGQVPGMTGKRHSKKTRNKMSASQRRAHAEGRGNRNGFRGHHTDETKAVIRAKRLLQADPRLGKKHMPDAIAKMSRAGKLASQKRQRNALGHFV